MSMELSTTEVIMLLLPYPGLCADRICRPLLPHNTSSREGLYIRTCALSAVVFFSCRMFRYSAIGREPLFGDWEWTRRHSTLVSPNETLRMSVSRVRRSNDSNVTRVGWRGNDVNTGLRFTVSTGNDREGTGRRAAEFGKKGIDGRSEPENEPAYLTER